MSKVRLNSDNTVLTVENIDSQLQSKAEIINGTEENNLTVCNGHDLMHPTYKISSSSLPVHRKRNFCLHLSRFNEQGKFGICVAGILISYFVFGLITEKINECYDKTEKVCENGKYKFAFVQSALLSFCYWSFAKGALTVKPDEQKDETHIFYYIVCGLLNVFSIVASTTALESVSYPTQVITKSAKPVTVIALCSLLRIKTYPLQKYVFVVIICIGVGLAIVKTDKIMESTETQHHIRGILLLLFSLLIDGVLAVIEERMCATTAPSALKMMASLNGWSTIYLLALVPIQASPFYKFVEKYPKVMVYLAGLALSGTFGQVFIFLMISLFGTLPCAITTTVRKVFSTVFSVLYKNNKAFSAINWSGVALVFGSFFGDILYRRKIPENI